MNKEKTINKPMSIARQEFIESLLDTINNSGLPIFTIESILKDMYVEVQMLARKQYEAEKEAYEKELAKAQEKESESEK